METKKNYKLGCDELKSLVKRTRFQAEALSNEVVGKVLEDTRIEEVALDENSPICVSFDVVGLRVVGIAKRVIFNRIGDGRPPVLLEVLATDNTKRESNFRKVKFSCTEDLLNIVGQVIEKTNLD